MHVYLLYSHSCFFPKPSNTSRSVYILGSIFSPCLPQGSESPPWIYLFRARGRDDSEFTGWYLAWWTLLRDLRDDIFKKTLNCAHHKRVKHELMKMQELYFMNLNLVFGIILTFRFKSSYSINSQLQRHPMPCHMAGNGNGSISWNFGSSIIAPHTKTPKRHPREGRCTYNVQAA